MCCVWCVCRVRARVCSVCVCVRACLCCVGACVAHCVRQVVVHVFFKHMCANIFDLLLSGVKGLEVALKVDKNLDTEDPEPLFDLYLNTCPYQGSRTIRTEEAILVTLSALRPKFIV